MHSYTRLKDYRKVYVTVRRINSSCQTGQNWRNFFKIMTAVPYNLLEFT